MSEYLETVIKASGGHAAPVENLNYDNEAALDKGSDDPCWEGYVQVGMKKGKDGNMVPNCVPLKAAQALEKVQGLLSSEEIEAVLSHYNSQVGGARQVALSAAAEVAARSYDAYFDSCPTAELSSAILWELHSFLEYATLGETAEPTVVSEHDDLLTPGHPAQGMVASVDARIEWLAAAPELDESSRESVIAALSDSSSELEAVHAYTRLRALTAGGVLSSTTSALIEKLATN